MSSPDDLLRQYAHATEPEADAQARVAGRLSLSTDPEAATALLKHVPGPDDFAIARVLARIRQSIRYGRTVRMPIGTGPLVAVGAAAGVLVLGLVMVPELVEPEPPVMIAATLEATTATSLSPAPGVDLQYTGWGFVSGSERAPRLQWGAGSLHVEVEPGADVDLRIETPNGEVQVVGTVFDVHVDDLGTQVSVLRGKVRVLCDLGATSLLGAGDDATCVRASAPNLLNFAVQARTRGGTAGQVLTLAEQGLALSPEPGLVRDELRLVQFQSLLELERVGDARDAADVYLTNPHAPRRVDVLRTTAKLAFAEGSCAMAAPYLTELAESGGAGADDLVPLARCLGRSDPQRAQELLDRAEALPHSAALASTIASLRESISAQP